MKRFYIPRYTKAEQMKSLWDINADVSEMCFRFHNVPKIDIDLTVCDFRANYEPARRTA